MRSGTKPVRELYDQHLKRAVELEMGIERAAIAYSRPPNIGDYVTQTSFHKVPGKNAEFYLGELKQGLDPC